jgi:hypothetical protein
MVFIHAIGVQISLGSPSHNSFSFTHRYQHIRVLTYTSYISAAIKTPIQVVSATPSQAAK